MAPANDDKAAAAVGEPASFPSPKRSEADAPLDCPAEQQTEKEAVLQEAIANALLDTDPAERIQASDEQEAAAPASQPVEDAAEDATKDLPDSVPTVSQSIEEAIPPPAEEEAERRPSAVFTEPREDGLPASELPREESRCAACNFRCQRLCKRLRLESFPVTPSCYALETLQ